MGKRTGVNITNIFDYSGLHKFRDFYYMYDSENKQWVISDSDDIANASIFYFSENYYRIDEAIENFYEQKMLSGNKVLFQFKTGNDEYFFTTAWIWNMIPICRWRMK